MSLYDVFLNVELTFAGILLGFILGMYGSVAFNYFSLRQQYQWNCDWAAQKKDDIERCKNEYLKKRTNISLGASIIFTLLVFGVIFYSFIVISQITIDLGNSTSMNSNASNPSLNTTIILNNYTPKNTTVCNCNSNVEQSITINRYQEPSIKELWYFINGKNRFHKTDY